MPLYFIGLGLGDERDVTIRGADCIRTCAKVFLESYTSILGVSKERLEAAFGRPIEIAWRETVESESQAILGPAKDSNVAFLVVGDVFGATTHTDLLMRAQDEGVETHVIHNASIMNAAGACGLQLYNFGHTVSIPFFRPDWRPHSFYERIEYNRGAPWGAMHTLCLLDIKVREPNYEALVRGGRVTWEPPRFMSVNEAVLQLLEVEGVLGRGVCGPDALAIGLARLGQDSQRIFSGTLATLARVDFGGPLHSLVLVGAMHDLETAMFERFRWKEGDSPLWVPPPAAPPASGSEEEGSSDSDGGEGARRRSSGGAGDSGTAAGSSARRPR